MAVVGDLGVIGAYGVGSFQGAVYVYNLASGVLVRTLSASDGVSGDQFGYAVAAKGTRVLVGANGRASSKGAAYLFDLSTGLQLNRFDLDVSGVVNDNFGAAVAVDGNLGLIGAYGRSSSKGDEETGEVRVPAWCDHPCHCSPVLGEDGGVKSRTTIQ